MTTKWTKQRHEEMRELCEKATPGKWYRWLPSEGSYVTMPDKRKAAFVCGPNDENNICVMADGWGDDEEPNAEFIAHARQAIPDLLDEVERLQEFVDDFENAVAASLNEKCSLNEMHCACVPYLREENKRLQERVDSIMSVVNEHVENSKEGLSPGCAVGNPILANQACVSMALIDLLDDIEIALNTKPGAE